MRRVVIEPRPDPVNAPARPRLRYAFGYSNELDGIVTWEDAVRVLPVRAHARRDPVTRAMRRRLVCV